jgi:hypothetical protein
MSLARLVSINLSYKSYDLSIYSAVLSSDVLHVVNISLLITESIDLAELGNLNDAPLDL